MTLNHPHAPKWSATHAERIQYLTNILSHPSVQHNVRNTEAAIRWHQTFPSHGMCEDRLVYFQNREKVDDWDPNVSAFWLEVSLLTANNLCQYPYLTYLGHNESNDGYD